LLEEYEFGNDMLPTKHQVLLYVMSRTFNGKKNNKIVVNQMSKSVENIWKKADCCPFTQKHISKLFEQQVWKPYLHLRRERCLSGEEQTGIKRSHKRDPSKAKERSVKNTI